MKCSYQIKAIQTCMVVIVFASRALVAQDSSATESTPTLYFDEVSLDENNAGVIKPEQFFDPMQQPFVQPVQFEQSQQIAPRQQPLVPSTRSPISAEQLTSRIFESKQSSLLSEIRRDRARQPNTSVVFGRSLERTNSTDAASLLGKSVRGFGTATQRRTPIITDARVRGNGVGRLNGSGSYWVPARADLDTMLSKLDSGIIDNMIVIKGPYSARYGPGYSFIDVELIGSPRYQNGFESHGVTRFEYETNGQQLYGRQTLLGGSSNWGYRVTYGHRHGQDYESGNGRRLPSGYESRDLDVAIGFDISRDQHLEFNYLRMDQTDVQFPGQFFDIDSLVTDGFELTYTEENGEWYDRMVAEGWHNRTRFKGNALTPSKLQQIPSLAVAFDKASTNVDSISTGFSVETTFGEDDDPHISTGVDLRYVKQELNEFTDVTVAVPPFLSPPLPPTLSFVDVNSPVPRSHMSNPGLFSEIVLPFNDQFTLTGGGRVDWISTNVEDNPEGLNSAFPQGPITKQFIADQLRTEGLDKDFQLWALFGTAEFKLDDHVTLSGAAGVGMRAPTLTELYAGGPSLGLLQNGINGFLGNPNLDPSRQTQLDLSVRAEYENFRGGVGGFYAWVKDFITYEVVFFDPVAPPLAEPNSRALTYVNTPRATLAGGEAYGELDLDNMWTAYGTLTYVEGRDKTRNAGGQQSYDPSIPAFAVDPTLPRGTAGGEAREPLPSISPLESRIGIRAVDPKDKRWIVDFSARIVDNQDRVAKSIVEFATPGFTTFDLQTSYQLQDNWVVMFGVNNIGNKNYREHLDLRTGLGVFQPGRSVFFGSELTY